MILSAQSIEKECSYSFQPPLLDPFVDKKTLRNGKSYGLSSAGYDIRSDTRLILEPGDFKLGVSMERFSMPPYLMAFVKDKSSWARRGISVFNTVIEPNWCGYLTLEIVNHSKNIVNIEYGDPVAQVIFLSLDQETAKPYNGKYQDAPQIPQGCIDED